MFKYSVKTYLIYNLFCEPQNRFLEQNNILYRCVHTQFNVRTNSWKFNIYSFQKLIAAQICL